MADLDNLPDLEQSTATFRTAFAQYLAEKTNKNASLTAANVPGRAVAQWGDFVDGMLAVLQGYVDERVVQGVLNLGAGGRALYYVTSGPESVQAAEPGSVALKSDGTVWRKETGSGDTGWVELGAGGGPAAEYHLDFRQQTAGAVGSTTQTWDGLEWQVNTASGDTLEVTANGLEFTKGGSSATAYHSTSQTASHLEVELEDLHDFLGIDARHRIDCYVYFSTFTTNGASQYANLLLRGDSADPANYSSRAHGATRGEAGGQQIIGSWDDGGLGTYTYPFASANVLGLTSLPGNALSGIFGAWDTDFDTTKFPWEAAMPLAGSNQSTRHQSNKLGLGFQGTTTNGWVATVQQLIVRAYL